MGSMRYRLTVVGVTAATVVAGLGAAAAPSSAAAGDVTIANTKPVWLGHAARMKSAPAASGRQTVKIYLQPNGGIDALKAKVDALTDPGSADYGKWLTPAQFTASYAPTQASVDAVSGYLKSSGLALGSVEAHRRYVEATGTVAQLDKAFGVTLGSYSHDGQTVTAPSEAVTLPSAVGAAVLTVAGLDTTRTVMRHSVTPPDASGTARPCSTYFGQLKAKTEADFTTPLPAYRGKTLSYAPCGYTGPQFRAAYEGDTRRTGAGTTIAITDAYDWQFIAKDASTYAKAHGDAAYATGQLTRVPADSYNEQAFCDAPGWTGEETLDVEAAHAMAPAANIVYYAGKNCEDEGLTAALARVVDDNKANLVTNSWDDVEEASSTGSIQAYEQIFLQGAAQGISFLFSSGDDGDELAATGLKQVDYPASDPYVTAVGGTSTGIDSDGSIKFQTGWGTGLHPLSDDARSWTDEGFLYGAGGGYSTLFNRPKYQDGTVPSGAGGRAVPDIAMDADPATGMLVGQTQTFPDGVKYGEYRIGGTSLASPLAAGFLALHEQKAGRLGLLNPKLYQKAGSTVDVSHAGPVGLVRADYVNGLDASTGLTYSVRTFDQDSSLSTAKGWDTVTGLGVLSPSLLK